MYRYIKSNNESDFTIDAVVFVDDVFSANVSTVLATDRIEEDAIYDDMDDSELLSLDSYEIHAIADMTVLTRIARLDKSLLSEYQINLIKKFGEISQSPTEIELEDLLNQLHKCTDAQFMATRNYLKNLIFENEYPDVSMVDVIRNLAKFNFKDKRTAGDDSIIGDDLFIFTKLITYDGGEIEKDIEIFIKLDKHQTTNNIAAVVSFHLSNMK